MMSCGKGASQKRVGAGSGPSGQSGGGGAGYPPAQQHVASMLNGLEADRWEIPLANIRFTEHCCRQTSPAAL